MWDAFIAKITDEGGTSATLTVSVTGSGTVNSTPGGINCGSDCSESYTPGTTVMLTATPASGYVFSGWGGDCAWSGPTCTLTMDANKSAVAIFQSQTPWVIPPDRFEGGTVTPPLQLGGQKAVVITHGWDSDATGWVKDMATAICNQLGNPEFSELPSSMIENSLYRLCSTPNGWVVYIQDWRKKADLDVLWGEGGGPWTAYVNADTVGKKLATDLKLWQHPYIHFIAHSAGSQVIDTATNWLKIWAKKDGKPVPTIHETFLDAYDPRGQDSPYGLKAEWSDNYVDTHWVAPDGVDYTQLWLKGAYSIDVTSAFSISSCGFSIYSVVEPPPVCYHAWPYRYYSQTTDNPSGIGFPLSLEKGQSLATLLAQYPKGESCEIFSCEGGPRRMRALAQQCVREVFNAVSILSPTILEQSGTAQCTSGAWLCGTITLNTSSLSASQVQSQPAQAAEATAPTQAPAWLVVHILTDQPANTLRFNWRFAAGGEGLLRVFANEKLVREIDQRYIPAVSPEPESVYVGDLAPGTHKIAFRLDGYGANPSSVELMGVELGQQTLVVDTTPPTITSVTASPKTLWPPNHKMVLVTVTATATDQYDPAPVCAISSVASNEPDNGTGDGDMVPDWEIIGALTANLRAERAGNGTGRVYTLTVRCVDTAGNSATKGVTVTVPHDKGK